MDDAPLTAATFRAELRRHRWATWRGLWGIILLVGIVAAMFAAA
jgi:hypothetical protein